MSPDSFFGLEVGQAQSFQDCRVQPNDWSAGLEAKETPKMSRSQGWGAGGRRHDLEVAVHQQVGPCGS